MKEKDNIEIRFLDHVAIRVKDIDASIKWYQKYLGLKKCKTDEWGDYPIFMLSGKSGVAIFPANLQDAELNQNSKNIKIDHFAFNVDKSNFEKAKTKFNKLGLSYKYQDHFYFDSIYMKDPDGHTVELTTIKLKESEFYKK